MTSVQRQAVKKAPPDPLERVWHGKTVRRHILEFGVVFLLLGAVISAWLLWKGFAPKWPLLIMAPLTVLLGLSLYAPRVVHPLWKGWMAFAEVLAGFMTGLILFVTWTLMVIPIALVLRVIGKKVMDTEFRQDVASYWEDRDPKFDDVKLFEKQF